jgi:hypothetical protein
LFLLHLIVTSDLELLKCPKRTNCDCEGHSGLEKSEIKIQNYSFDACFALRMNLYADLNHIINYYNMLRTAQFTKLSIIIILVPLGLFTKHFTGKGNEFISNYLGGLIYVIFFIIFASLIFPKITPLKISLIVLCVTCIFEISQLIQSDFLNNLRKYFIIKTLIGSVFNIFDFIFYITGAFFGFGLLRIISEMTIKKEKRPY